MGRCYRCGKIIKAGTAVPLELNSHTGIFSDGGVPENESQGWFDFGPDCGPKSIGQRVSMHKNATRED